MFILLIYPPEVELSSCHVTVSLLPQKKIHALSSGFQGPPWSATSRFHYHIQVPCTAATWKHMLSPSVSAFASADTSFLNALPPPPPPPSVHVLITYILQVLPRSNAIPSIQSFLIISTETNFSLSEVQAHSISFFSSKEQIFIEFLLCTGIYYRYGHTGANKNRHDLYPCVSYSLICITFQRVFSIFTFPSSLRFS